MGIKLIILFSAVVTWVATCRSNLAVHCSTKPCHDLSTTQSPKTNSKGKVIINRLMAACESTRDTAFCDSIIGNANSDDEYDMCLEVNKLNPEIFPISVCDDLKSLNRPKRQVATITSSPPPKTTTAMSQFSWKHKSKFIEQHHGKSPVIITSEKKPVLKPHASLISSGRRKYIVNDPSVIELGSNQTLDMSNLTLHFLVNNKNVSFVNLRTSAGNFNNLEQFITMLIGVQNPVVVNALFNSFVRNNKEKVLQFVNTNPQLIRDVLVAAISDVSNFKYLINSTEFRNHIRSVTPKDIERVVNTDLPGSSLSFVLHTLCSKHPGYLESFILDNEQTALEHMIIERKHERSFARRFPLIFQEMGCSAP